MIAPGPSLARRTPAGQRVHLITVQGPGAPVPDGDGGYTQTWADLDPPQLKASITNATARDLELLAAGTVISQAAYVLTMPYHPQITTAARVLFRGRVLALTSVANREERNVQLVCLATEVLP
jgi:head-tail adaptor